MLVRIRSAYGTQRIDVSEEETLVDLWTRVSLDSGSIVLLKLMNGDLLL